MTFLPIVARELRVASRRRATYWSRSVTALLGIVIGSVLYLNFHDEAPHEVSKILFIVISVLAFLYCLLAGVRSTADCLSEEKREGTLGLLFLTDLKGYDVVGGKLVATSLNAFYGLMAIFPLLAIPLLMGGITNGEFWRTTLVLLNTFLFSLATGMFVSSISQSPRKAIAGTFLTMLFFSAGLPIFRNWIPWIYNDPQATFICKLFEPSYSVSLIADITYVKLGREFWQTVGTIHGLSWFYLLAACYIVPRSWQDNPPGAKGRRWRQKWHDWNYGDVTERGVFRRRLLEVNAFFWLAARARLKPAYVWLTYGVLGCFWTWGALEQGKQWTYELGIYITTAVILNTTLKLWIASEAGRRLGEDRKIGALELLLSTPLSVPDILRGQFLALRRQFLAPLLFTLALECIFMVAGWHNAGIDAETTPRYFCYWIAGMSMLVADILTLSTVGMWVGLTARNPNRATSITVARVLILPLAIGFVISIGIALVSYSFSSNYEPGWKFGLVLWFGLGMATDAMFGLTAWRKLQTSFREVATQRFAAMPFLWSRLFSKRDGTQ